MTISKIFTSSVDPNKLGLTVKGFLVMLVPIILVVANVANWNLGQEELNAIVDNTVDVVVAVGTLISTGMILWGAIRKVLVRFGWVKPKA